MPKSPAAVRANQKYQRSEQGIAARQAYDQSPAGRVSRRRAQETHRRKVREQIDAYKLAAGCIDCGYRAHAIALDFDHRPDEIKLFTIAAALHFASSRLWAEIAKCDVRCSNCHRVITAARRVEN